MSSANASNLQLVTTPTLDWLSEHAEACNSRVLISSPYVNNGIFGVTNLIKAEVSRTLITRTDLRDFAVGASNLGTACALAHEDVTIRNLNNLHAKMYIFDDDAALITSGISALMM